MQHDGASVIQINEFLWDCCKGFNKFRHVALLVYGANVQLEVVMRVLSTDNC